MTITIPSGRTIALAAKDGGGFQSLGLPGSPSGNYAIQGAGFGSRPSVTPTFDDFESESVGAVGSSVGNLSVSFEPGMSIVDAGSYSGTKCLSHDFSVNDFPKLYRALSGLQPKGYMAQHVKVTGSNSESTVYKYGRVGAGATYSGNPKFGESYTSSSLVPESFGGEVVTSNGIVGFGANADYLAPDPSVIYTPDVWHFYELEWDAGTVGNGDSFFEARCDGSPAVRFVGIEFLTAANSNLPDWVLTFINGFDQGPNVTALMDNVYVDESRARVVMTDSATYANATKWAVQPITAYSDTEVTCEPKRQGFGIGDAAYLHLFDNSGSLVSSGSSFTVEAD